MTCIAWTWAIPCLFAYSSRFCLIFATHPESALGSSTVTMTTGAPLPIAILGSLGAFASSLFPPVLPNSQKSVTRPRIASTTFGSLSLRNMFFSAGGNRTPDCCRAAYGGGRDVFRGGMAKCIVCGGWWAARERPLKISKRTDVQTRDGSGRTIGGSRRSLGLHAWGCNAIRTGSKESAQVARRKHVEVILAE
jgi:hypothetical protein